MAKSSSVSLGNAAAVEETVAALEDEGRLGPADAALVAMARTAAAALDLDAA